MVFAFVILWGLVALTLGCLFTFRPDIPADVYIAWMSKTRLTDRARRVFAPRSQILLTYRVIGSIALLAAVLIPVLVFSGVIAPRR